jgi:hypothetical protein
MVNLKYKNNNDRIKLILVLLFFSFSVLIGVYVYNLRYLKVDFDEANRQLYLKKQFSGNVIDKKTSKNKSTILVLNNGTEVLTVPHFVVNVKLGDSISKKENDSLAYIYSKGKLKVTFNYLNFKTSH